MPIDRSSSTPVTIIARAYLLEEGVGEGLGLLLVLLGQLGGQHVQVKPQGSNLQPQLLPGLRPVDIIHTLYAPSQYLQTCQCLAAGFTPTAVNVAPITSFFLQKFTLRSAGHSSANLTGPSNDLFPSNDLSLISKQ